MPGAGLGVKMQTNSVGHEIEEVESEVGEGYELILLDEGGGDRGYLFADKCLKLSLPSHLSL